MLRHLSTLRLLAAKLGIHYLPRFTIPKTSLLPLLCFRTNVFETALIQRFISSLCYAYFSPEREKIYCTDLFIFYLLLFYFHSYILGLHSACFQSSLFFLILSYLFPSIKTSYLIAISIPKFLTKYFGEKTLLAIKLSERF